MRGLWLVWHLPVPEHWGSNGQFLANTWKAVSPVNDTAVSCPARCLCQCLACSISPVFIPEKSPADCLLLHRHTAVSTDSTMRQDQRHTQAAAPGPALHPPSSHSQISSPEREPDHPSTSLLSNLGNPVQSRGQGSHLAQCVPTKRPRCDLIPQ